MLKTGKKQEHPPRVAAEVAPSPFTFASNILYISDVSFTGSHPWEPLQFGVSLLPRKMWSAPARRGSSWRSLARQGAPLTLRVRDTEQEQTIELPAGAVKLLQAILEDMASGRGVTIVPQSAELTTQQAADFLNVSRPFLVRLLEEKRLPFRMVGSHRRVRFEDILVFKQKEDVARRKVLDELVAEAQELQMEY